MNVAIIGGGAAGFFAAIHVKINHPSATVTIFEKSNKLLAKVKVSGGGRCNVTNACTDVDMLSQQYPRGSRQLRKAFGHFSTSDTMRWFEERGVKLVVQEDDCVFPESQNSQTIIDCFMSETGRLGIAVKTSCGVSGISYDDDSDKLMLHLENDSFLSFDKVIVATGGQPKAEKFKWLSDAGQSIVEPLPSLFTFNMPGEPVKELMGVVVENATAGIRATKLKAGGPLLITHWGMSGPAILKLSAFGARILAAMNYDFYVHINWLSVPNEEELRIRLVALLKQSGRRFISNSRFVEIPQRLWDYLLTKINIPLDKPADELGKKDLNRLVEVLFNDSYHVVGKTTFKEEFVTAGGVSLDDIDFKTMQSKKMKGLYFAGEVMDVDGITGGFNFQSAWTTAFIAARLS
jgi:predicted Rossmann fold flavoprotein